MFTKRSIFAGVAGLAAAGGLAATAAPASAAASECPSNRFCLWFNSNYAGARADYVRTDGGLGNELFDNGPRGRAGFGVQVNNNAASAANRTGSNVAIYDAPFCEGGAQIIFAGQEFNLEALGKKNLVSSIYINGGTNKECRNIDSSGY